MGRLLFAFVLIALVYILWDRGTFGNQPGDVGPAQRLGASIDRGMAKAGRAVETAGKKLERAADGSASPWPSPTPGAR